LNKKQIWLNTVLSSLVMASLMSGIISGTKMEFSPEWPAVWLQSFCLSWPFALLLGFTVLPLVRKFSEWATTPRVKKDSTLDSMEIAQCQGTHPIIGQIPK